jgi:hypothetical protein
VTALDFVLASLATWRVSSLLVREEGPYALLARARGALATSMIGGALECFYCASLWVAAPIALWLSGPTRAWATTWLALSGAAILAERATMRPEPQPVDGARDARSGSGRAMELDEAVQAMNLRRS